MLQNPSFVIENVYDYIICQQSQIAFKEELIRLMYFTCYPQSILNLKQLKHDYEIPSPKSSFIPCTELSNPFMQLMSNIAVNHYHIVDLPPLSKRKQYSTYKELALLNFLDHSILDSIGRAHVY
jgi:hypothetical protein